MNVINYHSRNKLPVIIETRIFRVIKTFFCLTLNHLFNQVFLFLRENRNKIFIIIMFVTYFYADFLT